MATDEMPAQPKTVSLPAVTERTLLEDLTKVVRNMADNFGQMRQDVTTLVADRPILYARLASVEGRIASVESASMPPPTITSTRVEAIIDEHPSQMSLEQQAKIASVIIWQKGVDDALAATATKEDVKKVEEKIATESTAQTQAIINGIKSAAANPLVRKIAYASGVLVFQALTLATAYLAMRGHQ